MTGERTEQALARITAALARIEAASPRAAQALEDAAQAKADDARRHAALRAAVAETLRDLDHLIAGESNGSPA